MRNCVGQREDGHQPTIPIRFIAHRLSTIRVANRIDLLQAGQVVEMDRFEELLAEEGLLRDLAQRQQT